MIKSKVSDESNADDTQNMDNDSTDNPETMNRINETDNGNNRSIADDTQNNPGTMNRINDTDNGNNEDGNHPDAGNNNRIRRVWMIIGELKSRLRDEGASERTLRMLSEAARGSINDRLNPIDYNGMDRG